MTPAARLAAAAELLEMIGAATTPAEQHIGTYFRNRRYAGSKDRRWVTEFVYRALRRQGELDWAAVEAGLEQTPRIRSFLSLILFDNVAAADVPASWFGGPHGLSELTTEEEAALVKAATLDLSTMPTEAAGNFPEWLTEKITAQYGDQAGEVMRAYGSRAPVTLRVNAQKGTRSDIQYFLKNEGIDVAPTALSPDGLTIEGRLNLSRHPLLENGRIELQDEAAQIASRLADARPGMTVVDYCAGGGGKSLAMAATMDYAGKIYAFDTNARRMRDIGGRAKRAGVTLIEPLAIAGDDSDDEIFAPLVGQMDRVFVDAPCSGSGTWRRQPDQKWKLTEERLAELTAVQSEILSRAAPLVAPGGRLIYATCSILREENAAQIDAFLSSHPEFSLLPVSELWETVGLDGSWADKMFAVTPTEGGSDGFFTAVLEKSAQ
ncbi:RsmB/NOP family class I SAM-dependent RNA methyltransferase [Sneathiella sp. HT1-7]|uniref:RsmB/NOP family class I SAM-dependent RNA methyltransferase n=1 Tax=Sneathiella sp. HT1-7 TaxID=2887192 RepID=UPI001D159298|nr:RsmB/NOP family class I SAM-dependent RNA methyltransferase [Sneathiella sp. HT1-7]MCC3304827.1 RsmB/NOP family class I SAM-dependent RNA methyltransferase [Sneathiella sp. HT1-7]